MLLLLSLLMNNCFISLSQPKREPEVMLSHHLWLDKSHKV